MQHAFIADNMLGRLARWLRVMGCDVEYFPEIGDAELIERSEQSGRLILTRDTLLVRRRQVRANCLFVAGDHFRDQVRQVVRAFAINPCEGFLTRCLNCNALLQDMARERAAGRVPPYVFATREHFQICPDCSRLYWGGTHRDRMKEDLREMLMDR
jgi:uncharacterized protein with PIN domain